MVMNFGLRNAPATFQRLMDKMLRPVKVRYGEEVQAYMDNVIIATTDDLDHYQTVVKAVLQAFKDAS